MTTLVAWIGVDGRGPASLYIASESRLTALAAHQTAKPKVLTDCAQKIFACAREPHLFGYCGWVEFPLNAILEIVAMIDHQTFFCPGESVSNRCLKVTNYLETQLKKGDRQALREESWIIYNTARV